MKTIRLIMAMVLIVGLIGVFSAFGAEQTKQDKKEGIITETQESKDKKKAPAPGSTTMQAPAANLQSLPLTITRLYIKDGKLRVVIKKQGSKRLSDEDYKATKLKVEASTLIKPLEWTLREVDPRKHLNHLRREKDFDTGLAVTERVQVTATLYRGLWKTAKEGTLYPKMAKVDVKTSMGTPEKEDTFHDLVQGERTTTPSKIAPGVIKETMDAPGRGSRRVAKGAGDHRQGVRVYQPRRGAIHSPGDRIPVLWQCSDPIGGEESECGEGRWNIYLTRGDIFSDSLETLLEDIDILYSDHATPGTAVEVELPEDLEDGDDYFVYVEFAPARLQRNGSSGTFSIGSLMLPIPDGPPTGIHLLEPDGGETWMSRLAYEIRWEIYPIILPAQDDMIIRIFQEDGSAVERIRLSAASMDLGFDNVTRVYSYTYVPRPSDPGRHRVSVEVPGIPGETLSDSSELITITSLELFDDAVEIRAPLRGSRRHVGDDLRVEWRLNYLYEEALNSDLYTHTGTEIIIGGGRSEDEILAWETVGPTELYCDISIPDHTPEGTYLVRVGTLVEYNGSRSPIDDRRYGEAFAINRFELLPSEGYFFVVPDRPQDYYQGNSLLISWNALGETQSGDVGIQLYDDSGAEISTIGTYRNTRSHMRRHSYLWEIYLDTTRTYEDVYFRLYNIDDPSITAESERFNIRTFDVNVIAPIAVSTWHVGDRVTVAWEATPHAQIQEDVEVDIVLFKDGRYSSFCGDVPLRSGEHSWELFGDFDPDDDYTIRLQLRGPPGITLAESATFSIEE